ncbi:hypothetical protein [Rhodanobacter lindaniclasticus]|uniref:Uncharacterized protein n=1 Tax=Rhodanobacter lindaniclasticus TaxID=75310 RepID=A0A4S3KD43_9GAMM|nr:hypothetical protein [Rhodanobacter lindaniclasticus]THD06138.1 hypothetical protein B1991_14440 [Rhodanobacter lindaniclasticus]
MTPKESVAINHAELERLAREMCDSRNGAGHYDAKGTKRAHWRKRALPLAVLASEPQGIGRTLMQACGWLK